MKKLLLLITALFILASVEGQILRYSNYTGQSPHFLTNLVAYYAFEEASGTLRDSKNANDVETINGADYQQPGKNNYSMRFVRANGDHCVLAQYDDLTMYDQDFTIVAWIYQTGDAADGTLEGIVGGLSGSVGLGLFTADGETNNLRLTHVNNDAVDDWGVIQNVQGQWNMVAISFDSHSATNNAHLYYNSSSSDVTFNTDFDPGKGIRYIGNEVSSNYFDGYIDELMIWKGRFLDDTEIAALYNNGTGLFFNDFD